MSGTKQSNQRAASAVKREHDVTLATTRLRLKESLVDAAWRSRRTPQR